MGYLDELKRQADAARAQQTVDTGALERNTLLTDGACQTSFRYLNSLAQQLNVLQPVSRAIFRLDARNEFRNLRFGGFRADSRMRQLRGSEVFDHVLLGFDLRSGKQVEMARDFPPEIDKLEARLTQAGAPFESEIVRSNGRFHEKRFQVRADFHGVVRLIPDHDTGWIQFQIVNLEGFETVTVQFPAFEVGSSRLDHLARWIVGEPNDFLKDGQALRRVEY